MRGMMESLQAAQPILDLVGMLGGIAGLQLQTPSLAEIADEEDPLQGIRRLRDAIDQLQMAVEALPV
jgi:hypothetical protein